MGALSLGKEVSTISTGFLHLDTILKVGGLPRGTVVEIYGAEGIGKTTLVLQIAANIQKQGLTVALIDTEKQPDPSYLQKLGVDSDSLLVVQPDDVTSLSTTVRELTESEQVDLIIVDSAAALEYPVLAETLAMFSRCKSKENVCFLLTSQIRTNLSGKPSSKYVSSGTNMMKVYSSIRIGLEKVSRLKLRGETIGKKVCATVVKNRLARSGLSAEFDIVFGEGIK